jgi:hypothetical protein
MFPGSAFGVGVTVAELCPPVPDVALPPGVAERPMRLHEMLPGEALTDAELAREIQRTTQVEAVIAAYRVERVMQLAARRPASLDRRRGEPGAAADENELLAVGTSEFFPDELASIMNCSRTAATVLADTATTLLTRLPATWEALAAGELDWPRARALAAELGWAARETPPPIVTAVEEAVLPGAADMSVRALRAAARRELLARDARAADRRREQAERQADGVLCPRPDDMTELSVFCPHPLAAAIRETIDTYARLAKDAGDQRRLGQLRVGMLADLVFRPWDASRPPVTALLTVVAPLSALRKPTAGAGASELTGAHHGPGEPQPTAEVNGEPITAAGLRDLLEQVDALCPGGLRPPTAGSLNIALVDPGSGELRATVTRNELERLARRGCPEHPDATCTCSVLERPPPVDRYAPTPAQRRFVTTRDRTCRHPGCRNRSGWADLDHVLAHAAGGPTDCANLCCLCRRHHRLKTHGRKWSFVMGCDGVLTVTTPSGVIRTTRPPGLRLLAEHQRMRAAPPEPAPVEDDPPPF